MAASRPAIALGADNEAIRASIHSLGLFRTQARGGYSHRPYRSGFQPMARPLCGRSPWYSSRSSPVQFYIKL